MSKYGKPNRSNARRVERRKLADLAQKQWQAPPKEQWRRLPRRTLQLSPHLRMCVEDAIWKGNHVDFVIQLETLVAGEWHEFCRADCAEGAVHVHTGLPENRKKREIWTQICDQSDISDSYDDVYEDLLGSARQREWRWRHERNYGND